MKLKFFIAALLFAMPLMAQETLTNENFAEVNMSEKPVKEKKKKAKISLLRTSVGLACLVGACFYARQIHPAYNEYKQAEGLLNVGDDLAGVGQFLGLVNKQGRQNIKMRLMLEKLKLAAPCLLWGSATIAFTTAGLINVIKGLGLAK